MVNLYITLIKAGRRTLDTVAKSVRDDVAEKLDELGLDEEGNEIED